LSVVGAKNDRGAGEGGGTELSKGEYKKALSEGTVGQRKTGIRNHQDEAKEKEKNYGPMHLLIPPSRTFSGENRIDIKRNKKAKSGDRTKLRRYSQNGAKESLGKR